MNEKILLKANILHDMDKYIRDIIGDDNITDEWNMYGVPDECDEEMMMEIAGNEEMFVEIIRMFADLVE